MNYQNIDEEVLISVYKNAHIALQSISNIIGETKHAEMKDELNEEYDGYEKFIGKLSAFMKERGIEPKDINFMQKAFMFTSVKMNTLTNDSKSHIAELMIKGTVMGITELTEILNGKGDELKEATKNFVEELLKLEETYEQRLKNLL